MAEAPHPRSTMPMDPLVVLEQPDDFAWPPILAAPFLERLRENLNVPNRPAFEPYVMHHPVSRERTGSIEVFDGDGLEAVVVSTADTPMLRMWQVVAFAPPESALPHLSFDAKANPAGCWFSIDLIPRVACTEEPAWAEYVYEPLSQILWELHERDDMSQSLIRARHRMGLSPWLVTMRLHDASALDAALDIVLRYTDRFCDLVDHGIPADAMPSLTPQQLAARDARERERLYSWEATANYRYLAMIGGDESVDVVQETLRHPNSPAVAEEGSG